MRPVNSSIRNKKGFVEKAAETSKAVIDSCAKYGYKLGNYDKLWGADSYRENEMIFLCRAEKESNSFETNNFPIGVEGGKGGNCPTQTLVDAYEMTMVNFGMNRVAGIRKNPEVTHMQTVTPVWL